MRKFWLFSTLVMALTFSTSTWAYYAVLDNGEVLKSGRYKLTGDAQALTQDGGLNVAARFDAGFQEEFGVRALAGVGKTDFFVGGLFKWMPIPDLERQPAIGFNIGLLYGKDGDTRDLTFRFEPLISKRIEVDATAFTPYASLPLGLRMRDSDDRSVNEDTRLAVQLVVGSQLQIEAWKNLQFMAEVGIDIDNSPGYISGAAVLYFDEENGFTLN